MKTLKFAPYFLAGFAFFVYLITAAPFFLWLDAPRFVAAVVSMGVPNPPEPLYLMLAKPFSLLPIGSYIFRLQVFSSLLAAIALVIIYKITGKVIVETAGAQLVKSKQIARIVFLPGLFAMAMLAFSYQFWSQAQNVETFLLVVLIAVITLTLLITATNRKKFFVNFCIIAAVLGLATGTNPIIVSIVPTIIWVMWNKKRFVTPEGIFTWIAIGIIAIVLVHLYVPIRAAANPFLNYWRATDFAGVWSVSTGSGLNVFVPELGRINGFTGSPEIFFKSTWHFIETFFLTFTPIMVPFILLGGYYLWKKSKYHFTFWGLIIFTNWFFSGIYFSGNQESWFLLSDIAFVVMAGLGYYWLCSAPQEIVESFFKLSSKLNAALKNYNRYLILLLIIPFVVWFANLNRGQYTTTEDYIKNLYKPIGNEKAILFGSSDLFDSVSFYVHDVPGTSVYKPNVVPVTDNLYYIFQWYRDNLSSTNPDLKMPDGSTLTYSSADEYSKFVGAFFKANMDKYKIYVSVPAMRNNFLQVYGGNPQQGSLQLGKEFKLVPQGLLFQVVPANAQVATNLDNFNFKFSNGFPKEKPYIMEQTYKTELTGIINEYAYAFEYMGDQSLNAQKADNAFKFYQQAYNLNPNNAEIISRLGNYYGNVGDHQKAAEFFEKALKIEPSNVGLIFNLAIAYENLGMIDKATASFNKVMQLSRNNPQVEKLAKQQLEALRGGTASASNAAAQTQLPEQLPPGYTLYENKAMNIAFIYAKGYTVKEQGGIVHLTNGLTGKDELTMDMSSQVVSEKDAIEKIADKMPFKIDGIALGTQKIVIPGFQAIGKTYGTGEHITFLLLMKQNTTGFVIKVYPGDSNKSKDFNQILSSIRTIK